MRTSKPARRLVATAGAVTLIAGFAGCGGGDDPGGGGSASFCDEVQEIMASDDAATGSGAERLEQGLQQFQAAIDRLQELDPPSEISEDWNTVMDAYEAESPDDIDQEAVTKSGERLTTYMKDECGIEEG